MQRLFSLSLWVTLYLRFPGSTTLATFLDMRVWGLACASAPLHLNRALHDIVIYLPGQLLRDAVIDSTYHGRTDIGYQGIPMDVGILELAEDSFRGCWHSRTSA